MLADLNTFSGGERVGQYEVVSLIGTGGMGEVYLATDTELGRKVALKFIRQGLGSPNLLRRFRAEERILAALNHPNIAQLYGAAVTAAGVPYFVMEYVDGLPLDRFCEEHNLAVRDRLQLFMKVCSAVSYAHQNLVIHRDLKPGNIRVTATGEPKLLDFGIAKLLAAEADALPDQTITLAGVMTPEYASPEQVRDERVTTASDVYSLGVVLYELLAGQKPHRLTSRRQDQIARAITEELPQKPSAIALAHRKTLEGDLDNIVLMAIRKEPERRYASVAQFAEDIRRYLEGRTVNARKDTWSYRTTKFIRRNKAGVAAAAVVFLTLIGGIIATTYEARRAQRRFNEVRRLANSLMFEIHDSVQDLQGSTPTRRLIVQRALEYLDSLSAEGGSESSLQRELATAYEKVGDIQGNPYTPNLGDIEGALASYRKATTIREKLGRAGSGPDAQMELARSYRGVGDIMEQKGDIAGCLAQYRRSLEILQRAAAAAPDDNNIQIELARGYDALGDGLGRIDDRAERLAAYQQTLAIRQRLHELDPNDAKQVRGTALGHLKVAGVPGRSKEEVIAHMNQCIPMLEQAAAADPQNARARREVGYAYYAFGRIFSDAGDNEAALRSRQKALEIRQEIAQEDPENRQARFDLAAAHGELTESYNRVAQPAEAVAEGRKSLALLLDLTSGDPNNAVYKRNLGLCYERLADGAALMGANETLPAAERVIHLTEARDWYGNARDVFADLRDRGALMPTDINNVDKFTARVAETQQALERFTLGGPRT